MKNDNDSPEWLPDMAEMDKVLQSLYEKGFITFDTSSPELEVSITEGGMQAYLAELFMSMSPVIEA